MRRFWALLSSEDDVLLLVRALVVDILGAILICLVGEKVCFVTWLLCFVKGGESGDEFKRENCSLLSRFQAFTKRNESLKKNKRTE